MSGPDPDFLSAGETALVVEFGRGIDPATHDRVLAFDAAMSRAGIPGVVETVPTYRSVMVHYDPSVLTQAELTARLRPLVSDGPAPARTAKRWRIPACYDPPHSEDLAECASLLGLTPERVIMLHSGAVYRVYMYGFAPGFLHMGGLPPELGISRRMSPRPPVPSGSLIVAGGQAIVTTYVMPTGWYMLGRTPTLMFDPGRDPNFLIGIGDEVAFERIDGATYGALLARVQAGEPMLRQVS